MKEDMRYIVCVKLIKKGGKLKKTTKKYDTTFYKEKGF